MGHGVKYAVMNDYTRTVDIYNPLPEPLNGDTAVYSVLAARQVHKNPRPDDSDIFGLFASDTHSTRHYFNITEDWGIDDHECAAHNPPADFVPLLHSPLPKDLPPIDKAMLILIAAYYGDIDRYARLRRPQMIQDEQICVIRAIYHNVLWAKWWDTQTPDEPEDSIARRIRRAINARRIMSNDISCITASTWKELIPTNICWPECAAEETYVHLVRRRPDMMCHCLRACIVADYRYTWYELLSLPTDRSAASSSPPPNDGMQDQKLERLAQVAHSGLLLESRRSANLQYRHDLSSAPGLVDQLQRQIARSESFEDDISGIRLYYPKHTIPYFCQERPVQLTYNEGIYEGEGVETFGLGFSLFAKDLINPEHKLWDGKKNFDGLHCLHLQDFFDALEAKENVAKG